MLNLRVQLAMKHSDDLAFDQGVFVELVDGAQPVVAIRNHYLTVFLVSQEKQRRETYPLSYLIPVLLDM